MKGGEGICMYKDFGGESTWQLHTVYTTEGVEVGTWGKFKTEFGLQSGIPSLPKLRRGHVDQLR